MLTLIGSFFYWAFITVLKFLCFGSLGAAGPDRDAIIRTILPWLGVSAIGREDLQGYMTITAVYCYVLGWLFYYMLGQRGLGPSANALVSFFGCLAGLFVQGAFFGQLNASNVNALILGALIASSVAVMVFTWLRAWGSSEGSVRAPPTPKEKASKPTQREQEAAAIAARMGALANRKR